MNVVGERDDGGKHDEQQSRKNYDYNINHNSCEFAGM
jgi:hypothetical protein